MTIAERLDANAKNANISETGNAFTKSLPTKFDTDSQLNEGDKIQIPNEFKVFTMKFSGNATAEFIVVNVIAKDGSERSINFYPSCLTKNIWPVEKAADGTLSLKPGGPLNPTGSAVDAYTKHQGQTGPNGESDMQLGMNELKGKTIEVTSKEAVAIEAWKDGKRTGRETKTYLLSYKLA